MLISCGGPCAGIAKAFIGHKGVEIFNFYGSTEVSTWVFYKCSEDDLSTFALRYAPLGEVIPNNRYMISEEGLLISSDQICKATEKKGILQIDGTDWFSLEI